VGSLPPHLVSKLILTAVAEHEELLAGGVYVAEGDGSGPQNRRVQVNVSSEHKLTGRLTPRTGAARSLAAYSLSGLPSEPQSQNWPQ
jgi:hypothetical protein